MEEHEADNWGGTGRCRVCLHHHLHRLRGPFLAKMCLKMPHVALLHIFAAIYFQPKVLNLKIAQQNLNSNDKSKVELEISINLSDPSNVYIILYVQEVVTQFFFVTCYIKLVTTFWTYSMYIK